LLDVARHLAPVGGKLEHLPAAVFAGERLSDLFGNLRRGFA
jgi:hypothetical protein